MTNTLLLIRKTSVVLFIASLLMLNNVFSQEVATNQPISDDDPDYDRIPQWYLKQTQNAQKGPSSVVTIGDYDNFDLGTDFAETHISVDPTDPTNFFTAYNIDAIHRTTDGHDWTDPASVSWGTTIRGDVLTAFDSDGRLYYENMYGSPSILGCRVVRSTNNGASWGSAVTAISGVDKNWMAADQTDGPYSNYVYTVMTAGGGVGRFARSTNLGASWTNTFSPSTQSLPGMMVCVGAFGATDGGAVYVVTNSGSSFASTYTFYISIDGGATFIARGAQDFAGYVGTNVSGRNSVENMRTRPYPFITADNSNGPNRGRLYLVYASNFPAGDGNKPDIWCRYSDDFALTWSAAVRVNDDPNPQNNHQWSPAVWCDLETGRLYIHWMDTRDDATGDDEAMMYATYSDNGGVSFATNQKLSNEPMTINCTTCGGGGTPRYQGDYTSIVSNGAVSMSSWTDFRDGSYGSYTGYFPDYAMKLNPPSKGVDGASTVTVEIPSVKLYTDDVIFTASMQTPPSGNFYISFPFGNTLSTFPGSIPIEVTDAGVPAGNYTLTVTGKGPNGTPVHEREIVISVAAGGPNTWIGAFNSFWHNDNNWSAGHIPTAGEDVLITSAGYNPVKVDIFNEACNNLTINPGAHLDVYGFSLNVAGNLDNNGTMKFLDPAANVTAAGFSNIDGTVQMDNGTLTVVELNDSGVDGIWNVNNGSIVLNQTSGFPDMNATLNMTGGTMTVNDISSSCIWGYGAPPSVTMSGGILDFNCTQVSISNASVTENITGGTIRTSGNLTLSSTGFTPTGGTLELYGPNDAYVSQSVSSIVNLNIDKGAPPPSVALLETWEDREGNIQMMAPTANSSNPISTLNVDGNLNITSGTFSLNGQTVNVGGSVNVFGDLQMADVTDVLNVVSQLAFKSGSTGLFSNGEAHIGFALFVDPGSSFNTTAPNSINFDGSTGLHGIVAYEPASISTINFLNTPGTASMEQCVDLVIDNLNLAANVEARSYGGSNITINNYTDNIGSIFNHVETAKSSDETLSGNTVLTSMDAIPVTHFVNDVMVDGTFNVASSMVTADGKFETSSTGELIVAGGSLVSSVDISSGWNVLVGQTTLSSGSIEFPLANLQMYSSTISGGNIVAGRSFYTPAASSFMPTGGSVELVGSGPGHYIRVDNSAGNFFHDLSVSKTGSISVYTGTPTKINGNLQINSGVLNGGNNTISVGGAWTNNAGLSGFSAGTSTVVFNQDGGIQLVNGENVFNNVQQDKVGAGSNLQFANANTVLGDMTLNHLTWINDVFDLQGTLNLNNPDSKFTANEGGDGSIASLDQGGTVFANGGEIDFLDVVEPGIYGTVTVQNGVLNFFQDAAQYPDINCDLTITGGVMNFTAGTSGCIFAFDGATDITMSGGELNFINTGVSISGSNPFTTNITGGVISFDSFFNASNAAFSPTGGTVLMTGGVDATLAHTVGANFHHVEINKSGVKGANYVYKDRDGNLMNGIKANTIGLGSNVTINGDFNVNGGSFNMGNFTANVSGNTNINTSGTLSVTSGGTLAMQSGSAINVNSGGALNTIGVDGSPATITGIGGTGAFSFNVSAGGTLGAEWAIFEYMSANGIYLQDGSFVDPLYTFNNCTFRNGFPGSAALMVIHNDQVFTCSNVKFENTTGSTYNIWKAINAGSVTFMNSTGAFAGQAFEYDLFNRIAWSDGTLSTDLTVMLEGPYNSGSGIMNLGLNQSGNIPLDQPFNTAPWNYAGSETAPSIPPTVVDWVLVQVRDAVAPGDALLATALDTKAGFLLNDGSIVDAIGNPLQFSAAYTKNAYMVVYQRNHIGVMSNFPMSQVGGLFTYDFSSGINQAYGDVNAHKEVAPGVWGQIAGDGNANGTVGPNDKNVIWTNKVGSSGYLQGDFNLDSNVDNIDKNDKWIPNLGSSTFIPN